MEVIGELERDEGEWGSYWAVGWNPSISGHALKESVSMVIDVLPAALSFDL